MAQPITIRVEAKTSGAEKAFKRVERSAANLDRRITSSSRNMNQYGKTASRSATKLNRWAKGAMQQAGYQVGDFAVQVANGTSKMQAFGQQGSQLLGIFGPVGALIGAGVAIFSAFGVAAAKAGQGTGDFMSALGVLRGPVEALISSVRQLREVFGNVFGVLANNIDTVLIAVGLYLSWVGVRWVAASLAASASTGALSAALATYRAGVLAAMLSTNAFVATSARAVAAVRLFGATLVAVGRTLMRFLPIAVLIGLAKLIEIFMALVKGAGNFGNALGLLKALTVEVFARMGMAVLAFRDTIQSVAFSMAWHWKNALKTMAKGTQALFSEMATGIKDIPGMGFVAEKLHGVATNAGSAVHVLTSEMSDLSKASTAASEAAAKAMGKATAPLESWQAVKDAIKAGTEEVQIFGDKVAGLTGEGGGKGGSGSKGKGEKKKDGPITALQKQFRDLAETISSTMTDSFISIIKGTKSVAGAFKEMAAKILEQIMRIIIQQSLIGNLSQGKGYSGGLLSGFLNILGGFAKGGVFSGGKVTPFAGGGVVSGATPFPMQGGMGVMGEAGPEAIMPLKRGANGKLGVEASGGSRRSGATEIKQEFHFNLSANGDDSVRRIIMEAAPKIVDAAKSAVISDRRAGGAMKRAFS